MNKFKEEISCLRCKHLENCKLANNVKEKFGLKLKEMCFYCFESKDKTIIKDSFNNNTNCTINIG